MLLKATAGDTKCDFMVTPKHSASLTHNDSWNSPVLLSSRLELFCSTAPRKAGVTDTDVPVQTGTKSRCLTPDGWAARLVAPSR